MDRARLERPERHRDEEREAPRPQPPAEHLLQLQRTAGNAAVARAILARSGRRRPAEAFVNRLWLKEKFGRARARASSTSCSTRRRDG